MDAGGGNGGVAVAVRTDAGRIVDTSLQDEVEKSYLAVRLLMPFHACRLVWCVRGSVAELVKLSRC